LIFDEVADAEKILEDKCLDFFDPTKIIILAKYFTYLGKTKKETKNLIIEFCKSQNNIKYEDRDEEIITNALNDLKKYNIRVPKVCVITRAELDEIETVNDEEAERVFFVMICLAKYFMETNTSKNKKEYPEEKLIFWRSTSELFKMARYSENFFNRNMIIGMVERMGYIKTVSNKDRTKNHIYINTYYKDSEPVIFFDNPECVYKLYGAYKKRKLITCSVCGNSVVKNSNRQMMCKKCANKKNEEDNRRYAREGMKKIRENNVKGLENDSKPL
jgi:hypothetical protein